MRISKIDKVIAQLEVEKADAQKRCAADVAVLDLAIRKIKAQQGVVPKPTRRAKDTPKSIPAAAHD